MTVLAFVLTAVSLHLQYRIYLSGRAGDRRSHWKETEQSAISQ